MSENEITITEEEMIAILEAVNVAYSEGQSTDKQHDLVEKILMVLPTLKERYGYLLNK